MSKPTHTHCPPRHNTGILEILLGAALLCFCGVAFSQEKADLDAANRIRDAALNHSQIMEMVGYLTDVTGPRLTGSPNLKKAEEYARDRLVSGALPTRISKPGDLLAAAGRSKVSRPTCSLPP